MGIILTKDGKEEVIDLTSANENIFGSFESMLNESIREGIDIEKLVESNVRDLGEPTKHSLGNVKLRMPLVPPEVWGAGVTYLRSKDAREVETSIKGLYSYVYSAERPEIYFKTTGIRCVGPEDEICIRSDSKWTVPEPELTLVLGEKCNIVGYTIGNDVSARDIEGVNPLYLPQAKIFSNCCAIGPVVVTPRDIPNARSLKIRMTIYRGNSRVYEGSVSTSSLKRSLDELLSYLRRDNEVPRGSVFLTGTGIVPPDDFSLRGGDLVEIEIENVGKLRNRVRQL